MPSLAELIADAERGQDRRRMEHNEPTRYDVKRLPERSREAAGGFLSGVAGYPGDLQSLITGWADNAHPGYGPLYLPAMVGSGVNRLIDPPQLPTTEDVGANMGLDPRSIPFLIGAIGAPDAGDVKRIGGRVMSMADVLHKRPQPSDVFTGPITTPGAKVSTMARRVGTTGKYRGSPDIHSPQELRGLRDRLKASLTRGIPGRLWYERSSNAADSLTAGRRGLRDQYTGAIARTSADTAVSGNAGFAIKGYNQLQAGAPVHTGRYPVNMSADIESIGTKQGLALTDKTGPFYEANNVTTLAPEVRAKMRPTNDLWMARAFGYKRKNPKTGEMETWASGLGEAQHRFMDEEITGLVDWANKNKVGGFDDWTPEKVQASIWVDTKAAMEGTSIERAAEDFATGLDARSININSESAPAVGLEHMLGVTGDPSGVEGMTRLQTDAFTDDAGRNVFSTHANALTREQLAGQGAYRGETNPVSVNRILGGTETGSATLDPSSRKLAETIGSVEGMVKGQETVGYSFLRPAKVAADRNAAIGPSRDISEVTKVLEDTFDGNIIATPSGEGVRYLVVGDVPDGWQKTLKGIVGKEIQWRQNSGDLIGNTDFSGFKPSKYLETIDDTVAQRMDPITRWSAQAAEAIDDSLAASVPNPGARSKVLQLTRKIMAEGGIPAIREAVKKGLLPAVVLSVLVGSPPYAPPSPGPDA